MASYAPAQSDLGERRMIQEGLFSRTMDSLTGGVILAGFALALGATDVQIGVLGAIPLLAQLAHLPALALLRRFLDRRPLVAWVAGAARLLLLVLAALPFLDTRVSRVDALLALMAAYATLATLSGAGWQVWIREMVPRDRLGAWFGRRMAILAAVGLVTVLVAGEFVSLWRGGPLVAYALLFALGGACGLASALVLARTPSVVVASPHAEGVSLALRRTFCDSNYRRVLAFLAAWGFAANLALPFVSVVLLRTLQYPVALATLLAALSQATNVLGLRLWAPLTDRFGNKPVIALCAGLFVATMLAWALTPKLPVVATLVAAVAVHALLGFANAGLDVASTGLVMKMAPLDEAPAYLSSASLVKALAAGVAPLLGGLLVAALAGRLVLWFAPHDALFLASALLGLAAVHGLLRFREEGEAPAEAVMRAMRRDVGQPSSVAGMRAFAHVASYVVEVGYRFGAPARKD